MLCGVFAHYMGGRLERESSERRSMLELLVSFFKLHMTTLLFKHCFHCDKPSKSSLAGKDTYSFPVNAKPEIRE
jgi:hypothetical protein